jgi:hypothetical protein
MAIYALKVSPKGEDMILPRHLQDDFVQEQTAVIGNIEAFITYIEEGHAWRDWQNLVTTVIEDIKNDYGSLSDDIVRDLLRRP